MNTPDNPDHDLVTADSETQYDEEGRVIRPNRTALKREQQAIQTRILELAALPADIRLQLPLNDEAQQQLAKIASMKPSSARNREIRFVAKYYPEWDIDGIDEFMSLRIKQTRMRADLEKMVEVWRDRLLDNPDALTRFVSEHPDANIQAIRQLIRSAHQERQKNKPPAAARKLFKEIRALMIEK